MAKNKNIKKVVAKNGEVRYYLNGKRLRNKSGRTKWVKQNTNLLKENYSDKEFSSLKALQKYNEGYKFNGKSIQFVYVQLLKKLGVPFTNIKNNDLATIQDETGKPRFKNFVEVLRSIDEQAKKDIKFLQFCAEVGLPNFRNRDFDTFNDNRIKNIVDLIELLDSKSFKYYTLVVYDIKGNMARGRVDALLKIRDFEIFVGNKIQEIASNSAFMRFCYNYNLDIPKREILIDLSDINPDKKLQDFFTNKSSNEGNTIFIKDKYKDVEIEINFS